MNSVIMKPYRISEVDLNNIVYSQVKDGKNKKVVYIKYNNNNTQTRLTFQTTSLINSEDVQKKNGFYELDVPLHGKSNSKVNKLIEFLRDIDKKIINDARRNSNKWFNGTKNITYKSIIRSSYNKKSIYKNGVLRIKISDNMNTKPIILNNENNNIEISDITSNHYIKMILECYAIWITENGFGLYMKPVLLSFSPK